MSPAQETVVTVNEQQHVMHNAYVRWFDVNNDAYKQYPLDDRHLQYFRDHGIDTNPYNNPGTAINTSGNIIAASLIRFEQNVGSLSAALATAALHSIAPGTIFRSRHDLNISGMHKSLRSGVHHKDGELHSLLLAGYNQGEIKQGGNIVEYEYSGGRLSADGLEDMNAAANRSITNALKKGGNYLVRFIRQVNIPLEQQQLNTTIEGEKAKNTTTQKCFRYEGLYRVVKQLEKTTASGRKLIQLERYVETTAITAQGTSTINTTSVSVTTTPQFWQFKPPSYYWHGEICSSCFVFIPTSNATHFCVTPTLSERLQAYTLHQLEPNVEAFLIYIPTFLLYRQASK